MAARTARWSRQLATSKISEIQLQAGRIPTPENPSHAPPEPSVCPRLGSGSDLDRAVSHSLPLTAVELRMVLAPPGKSGNHGTSVAWLAPARDTLRHPGLQGQLEWYGDAKTSGMSCMSCCLAPPDKLFDFGLKRFVRNLVKHHVPALATRITGAERPRVGESRRYPQISPSLHSPINVASGRKKAH